MRVLFDMFSPDRSLAQARRTLLLIALLNFAALALVLVVQHGFNVRVCPWCVLQRGSIPEAFASADAPPSQNTAAFVTAEDDSIDAAVAKRSGGGGGAGITKKGKQQRGYRSSDESSSSSSEVSLGSSRR